ncbi:hypothetical protein UFOVP627_57 [uncultured Caudovirales phage]|uniref:Uncharacterized protein n=1 Tax=uncultured Caudovirales phage TaxID=2100421 RepID=A0A6J5N555_9CAUD|nr:hypothetical protein UFOVP627_57 [uncultured Caudovirales phage]
MAKNFPYFKFIATEWLTGDIVYEDFECQGLFINICALYWQRDGKLSIEDINRRYKNESIIQSLSGRFFSVNNGFISISFLDEQLIDANHISKVNSENGKKGAEKRKMLAVAKQSLSETSANFNKEEEKKNKIKVNNNIPSIDEFLAYAISLKPNVNIENVKLKYNSWLVNDWKINRQGKEVLIKNWKTTLSNTIQYLGEQEINTNRFKVSV